MSKGSHRRPGDERAFASQYERIFGRKTSGEADVTESIRPPIEFLTRIAITLDELRTIVFRTSVAYHTRGRNIQEAEWARAAALRDALSDLGFEREAEMIGGAG